MYARNMTSDLHCDRPECRWRRWFSPAVVLIIFAIESCGVLPLATRSASLEVRSQTLANGYLISLSSDRKINDVTAFIARGNWLVVTVVDSLLETTDALTAQPAFADSVEVTRFPTLLQLAFRLTVDVADVEVVEDPASGHVWISLFAGRRERRTP